MEWNENDLTLTSVHDSIEKNISEVKQQLNEIKKSSNDVTWLKNFVNNTLKPLSDLMSFCSINEIEEVRKLIIAIEEIFPDKIETSLRANKEVLPPVVMQNSISAPKKRIPRATAIRYPILTSPLLPKIYCNKMKIAQHRCHLRHFQDLWMQQVTVLRQYFIQITQKVLLPLRTFCKPTQQIISREEMGLKKDASDSSVKSNSHQQLEKIEFFIVETMNSVKERLWHQDVIREDKFSKKGISQEISEQIDCKRFGVVRLIPDIIQKLESVVQQSTIWLKHDLWYTQSSKSALCRAHRRCLKTEKLWQQACQIHERLYVEWNKASAKFQNSVNKLDNLEKRISSLQEEVIRLEGQHKIIKMKIQSNKNIENPEYLQNRQRAIIKRLNSTKTKLEARERSFTLLKSHSSSLKQVRSKTADKLVISENEVEMLQEKMLKFRRTRAAWHRRYHQKSDPDILRQQYQAVKLNIPLPAIREKTFVLKTRAERKLKK